MQQKVSRRATEMGGEKQNSYHQHNKGRNEWDVIVSLPVTNLGSKSAVNSIKFSGVFQTTNNQENVFPNPASTGAISRSPTRSFLGASDERLGRQLELACAAISA